MRPLLAAQRVEQVQDLRLHRDVERRGRLVEQQDLRLEDQRARDRDALALAAGELVRVAEAEATGRARPRRARCTIRASRVADAVDRERLGQDAVDGVARMQRAVGVLEHHLDGAVEAPCRAAPAPVAPSTRDAAGPVGREAADRAQHGRLAGAGFADEPEALARARPRSDTSLTASTPQAPDAEDARRGCADHRAPSSAPRPDRASSTGSGAAGRRRASAGSAAGRACRDACASSSSPRRAAPPRPGPHT